PTGSRLGRSQGSTDLGEHLDEIAAHVHGAEHVGLAEIHVRIPHPTEERAPVSEHDRADRSAGCGRRLESVPEEKTEACGPDHVVDAYERPSIERRRRHWR